MVYRGKPSKGCAECRAKKTRCDAAKPSCGQCRRAGRKCSGYRDLQELRMVDQSSEISLKAANNYPNKRRNHSDTTFQPALARTSPVTDSSPESTQITTPTGPLDFSTKGSPISDSSEEVIEISTIRTFPEPSFWLEGGARACFFDQYINVSVPSNAHVKTDLGFVGHVYENAGSEGMLESIISALGLSILMRQSSDSSSVSLLAWQKYSSALRKTQKALLSPRLAKADETLATVLLLGLHELVAVDDPSGDLRRHSVHLEGSIKLLLLRGQSQMDSNWGSRMIHRVCAQLTYSCLISRKQIPPSLLRFLRSITHKMHREELLGVHLMEIAMRLCKILNTSLTIDIDTPELVVSVLQSLLTIEEDLASWAANLSWRYDIQKIPVTNPDKSFLTVQESYLNHIVGQTWNRYRCLRLKASEEILRLSELAPTAFFSPDFIDIPFQHGRALSTVAQMSQEICQSVPFFLGEKGTCWAWQDKLVEPPSMFGASAMLMPLYFVAQNRKRLTPSMHEWILHQIARLGNDTGIAKAREILNEEEWKG